MPDASTPCTKCGAPAWVHDGAAHWCRLCWDFKRLFAALGPPRPRPSAADVARARAALEDTPSPALERLADAGHPLAREVWDARRVALVGAALDCVDTDGDRHQMPKSRARKRPHVAVTQGGRALDPTAEPSAPINQFRERSARYAAKRAATLSRAYVATRLALDALPSCAPEPATVGINGAAAALWEAMPKAERDACAAALAELLKPEGDA